MFNGSLECGNDAVGASAVARQRDDDALRRTAGGVHNGMSQSRGVSISTRAPERHIGATFTYTFHVFNTGQVEWSKQNDL